MLFRRRPLDVCVNRRLARFLQTAHVLPLSCADFGLVHSLPLCSINVENWTSCEKPDPSTPRVRLNARISFRRMNSGFRGDSVSGTPSCAVRSRALIGCWRLQRWNACLGTVPIFFAVPVRSRAAADLTIRRHDAGRCQRCPRDTLRQVPLIGLAIMTFALGQANAQSTKELPPGKWARTTSQRSQRTFAVQ